MRWVVRSVGIGFCLLAGQAQSQSHPLGLDGLKWLTGCWVQTADGKTVEEHWTDGAGGVMLEVGRTVKDGQLRDYEFTRIEMKDGVLTFTADPMDQPEASFTAKAQSADSIEFENLAHDFPQHVRYRSIGPDDLHAEIDGSVDGEIKTIGWDYMRCPS